MRSPYQPRPLWPPPDRAAWREYEQKSRAAADQYIELPITASRWSLDQWRECIHCKGRTRAADGQCRACKRSVVS